MKKWIVLLLILPILYVNLDYYKAGCQTIKKQVNRCVEFKKVRGNLVTGNEQWFSMGCKVQGLLHNKEYVLEYCEKLTNKFMKGKK